VLVLSFEVLELTLGLTLAPVTVRVMEAVREGLDMIRETNPSNIQKVRKYFDRERHTSHERHWIIVSLSFNASYILPHLQNTPDLKFWPYLFSSFTSSSTLCNAHRESDSKALVGQSQRKLRFGNNSICSWWVWQAIEQAEQMPRGRAQVRQR
jgi:hypothetical protein